MDELELQLELNLLKLSKELLPLLRKVKQEQGKDCPKELIGLIVKIEAIKQKYKDAPPGFVERLNKYNKQNGIAPFDTVTNTARRFILGADDIATGINNTLRMQYTHNRNFNNSGTFLFAASNQLNIYAGGHLYLHTIKNSSKAFSDYKRYNLEYNSKNPGYYSDQLDLAYLKSKKFILYDVPQPFIKPKENNNFIQNYEDTLSLSGFQLYRQSNGSISTYGNSTEALYRTRSLCMYLFAAKEILKNQKKLPPGVGGQIQRLMVCLSAYYVTVHAISFANASAQYFRMEEGPAKDKYFDLMLKTYLKDLPPHLYKEGKNDYWYHVDRMLTLGGVEGPAAKHDRVRRMAWTFWAYAKNSVDLAMSNSFASTLSRQGLQSGAFFARCLGFLSRYNMALHLSAHTYAISRKVQQGYNEGKYNTERQLLESLAPPLLSNWQFQPSTLTNNVNHIQNIFSKFIKTHRGKITPKTVLTLSQEIFNEYPKDFIEKQFKNAKKGSPWRKAFDQIKSCANAPFEKKLNRLTKIAKQITSFESADSNMNFIKNVIQTTDQKVTNTINTAAEKVTNGVNKTARAAKNLIVNEDLPHPQSITSSKSTPPTIPLPDSPPRPLRPGYLTRGWRWVNNTKPVRWAKDTYKNNKNLANTGGCFVVGSGAANLNAANNWFAQLPQHNNPVYIQYMMDQMKHSSRFLTWLSNSSYTIFRSLGNELTRQGVYFVQMAAHTRRALGNSLKAIFVFTVEGGRNLVLFCETHGGVLPAMWFGIRYGAKFAPAYLLSSAKAIFTSTTAIVVAKAAFVAAGSWLVYKVAKPIIAWTGFHNWLADVMITISHPVARGMVATWNFACDVVYSPVYLWDYTVELWNSSKYAHEYRKVVKYKDPIAGEIILGGFKAKVGQKILKENFVKFLKKHQYASYDSHELKILLSKIDNFQYSGIPIEPPYFTVKYLDGSIYGYIKYERAKELFLTDQDLKEIHNFSKEMLALPEEVRDLIIRHRTAKKIRDFKLDARDAQEYFVSPKNFIPLEKGGYLYEGKEITAKEFKKYLTTNDIIPPYVVEADPRDEVYQDPFTGAWVVNAKRNCLVDYKEDRQWKPRKYNSIMSDIDFTKFNDKKLNDKQAPIKLDHIWEDYKKLTPLNSQEKR